MRELALNDAGDLALDAQGRLRIVDGAEAVAQRIRVAVRTIQGEWVFDQTLGLPFFGGVVGKTPTLDLVRSVIVDAIAGVEGVARIVRLDLVQNRIARTLTVTGQVEAEPPIGEVTFAVDREVF